MRPLVRTRRQARQCLTAAGRALDDVMRAATRTDGNGRPVVPNGAVSHTAEARSHIRAALNALGNNTNHRNHRADAGE